MQQVNFILHLRGVMDRVQRDKRLNPSHISLYMALFMLWNESFFAKEFPINRADVMGISKIGSTKTYHRCIHDLHNWSYVYYIPSHNCFKGSTLRMFLYATTGKQAVNNSCGHQETSGKQAVQHLYKTIENIKKQNKTEIVFNEKKEEEETTANQQPPVSFCSNLHTSNDKNYDEPL